MKEDYRKYSCFFPPFLHPLPYSLPVFLTFFFLTFFSLSSTPFLSSNLFLFPASVRLNTENLFKKL